jgi:3-deoxy-D-manno-octulosonic-acid transferase
MLVIGSSILIEALIQRKPVLYLKYLHENTTLYEELEACWTIHNEEQLRQALISLQDNKRKIPYTDKNADKFLSEIIYGGQRERDVLAGYENFILSCAQRNK